MRLQILLTLTAYWNYFFYVISVDYLSSNYNSNHFLKLISQHVCVVDFIKCMSAHSLNYNFFNYQLFLLHNVTFCSRDLYQTNLIIFKVSEGVVLNNKCLFNSYRMVTLVIFFFFLSGQKLIIWYTCLCLYTHTYFVDKLGYILQIYQYRII